jgi:hypothetical protein
MYSARGSGASSGFWFKKAVVLGHVGLLGAALRYDVTIEVAGTRSARWTMTGVCGKKGVTKEPAE